ncbi:serine/threonine protein phosphatase, partial [mine drainage metagenome]
FVGLGDYIDRPPRDCGAGSVANALYLLGVAARAPERVFLLQGNHEATRSIPASPHDLPNEVATLWGPDGNRYDRIMGLLERGPYAASLPNAVYCAHAGFPLIGNRSEWAGTFDHLDEAGAMQILWAECDESANRRGAGTPWGGRDLERFFRATAFRIFLRGHDADLTGQPLFDGRCLTLHTTRVYETIAGVLLARVPLGHPIESLRDVGIEHLPTERRRYPTPGGSDGVGSGRLDRESTNRPHMEPEGVRDPMAAPDAPGPSARTLDEPGQPPMGPAFEDAPILTRFLDQTEEQIRRRLSKIKLFERVFLLERDWMTRITMLMLILG